MTQHRTALRSTGSLVALSLLVSLGGCRAATPQASETTSSEPAPQASATASPPSATLFRDSFDDDRQRWSTAGTGGAAVIAAGTYGWTIPPGDLVLVAVPDALRERPPQLDRVRVRVEVRVGAGSARVGIACRVSGDPDSGDLYVLSTRLPAVSAHQITRIAGGARTELARTPPAGQEVPDIGRTHVLEADCLSGPGGFDAALTVDGQRVLEGHDDDPLPAGAVGLLAASPPVELATEDVSLEFDEFDVERR